MKMKVDLRLKWASGLLVAAFVAAGCPPPPPPPAVATTTVAATPPPFQFKTKTGTPITMPQDPKLISSAVASRSFGTRADPFALLGPEHSFNQSQTSERVLVEIGGFATMYEPVPEVADQGEFVEPQPYRRLAGVLVGDTVSAIIVMEDGSTHLIKPGMRIPNSPWRVLCELHCCARRRGDRSASFGVEAHLRHAIALDPQRDAHNVAAGGAAGRAGVGCLGEGALPRRRVEVIGERPH